MSWSARRISGVAAFILTAVLLAPTAGSPAQGQDTDTNPAMGEADQPAGASAVSWQTLPTGDLVGHRQTGQAVEVVGVRAGDTGSGGYRTLQYGDVVQVVPLEAQPYIDAGLVDPELFDIGRLAHQDAPAIVVAREDGSSRTVTIPTSATQARELWRSLVDERTSPQTRSTDASTARSATGAPHGDTRLTDGIAALELAGATPTRQATQATSNCAGHDNPNLPGDGKVAVTISALDRRGDPSPGHFLLRDHHCRPWERYGYIEFGSPAEGQTFFLPPGTYSLTGDITTLDRSGRFAEELTVGGDLQLEVTGPTDVVVDARNAVPIEVDTPRPSEPATVILGWTRGADNQRTVSSVVLTPQSSSLRRLSAIPADPVTDGEFDLYPTFRLTEPRVTAEVNGVAELQPKLLPGSGLSPLDDALQLVDADSACAGCAVLVREDAATGIAGPVRDAVTAGAAAVLVMPAEPGLVHGRLHSPDVPVLAVSHEQGQQLARALDGPRLRHVDITLTPYASYLYDLAFHESGEIPDDLTYDVADEDVHRVVQRFHGDGTGLDGFETRYPVQPCRCSLIPMFGDAPAGTERVDYVSDNGSVWEQRVFRPGLSMRAGPQVNSAGSDDTVDWMGGPVVPGLVRGADLGDTWHPALADADALILRIPAAADNAGNRGNLGTTTGRLLRDGELVRELGYAGYATVPAGTSAATWRLEMEHAHHPGAWRHATSGEVAWTFRAGGGVAAPEALPLLDARVTLPMTRAGDPLPSAAGAVSIEPWRLDGEPVTNVTVALDVSVDGGTTWLPQRLVRTSDTWTARPALPGSGPVSLRLTVTDRDGSSMERIVHDAWMR